MVRQVHRGVPLRRYRQDFCDGKEVATINAATCKGCGGCAPYCPAGAIDLLGTTNAQIMAMIDALAGAGAKAGTVALPRHRHGTPARSSAMSPSCTARSSKR